MKNKKLFLLPLLATSMVSFLVSCNQNEEEIIQTKIVYGQMWNSSPTKDLESDKTIEHYHFALNSKNGYRTTYTELATLINNKESFIGIVVGSRSCICWQNFRDNIVLPYVKKYNLRVYYIENEQFDGVSDRFGIEVLSDNSNVFIVNEGKVASQKVAIEGEDFHDKYEVFAEWMDARITYPHLLYVSKNQLDNLYKGVSEASTDPLLNFTIIFARNTCSDCSYLNTNVLVPYLKETHIETYSYIIDCDKEGIRFTNGDYDETLWNQFKADYGLTYSASNAPGYEKGYVPTMYNVQCNAEGIKTGDFINAADVFFNDSYEANGSTVTITSSYFTSERLEEDYMSYLKDSSVSTKVLKGLTYQTEKNDYTAYKDAMSSFHSQIAIEFLNNFVKD